MSQATSIEWATHVWNPVSGCTKVSAGCKHCYAESVAKRFWKGRDFGDVRCHPERLAEPLRWRKPRRVFVNSMSDLFHEEVPRQFIQAVFGAMIRARGSDFLVLTKRPEEMREEVARLSPADAIAALGVECPEAFRRPLEVDEAARIGIEWPPPNVWLGVSVEDQAAADARIPVLLDTPAAVRFLSVEPLLGPVQLGTSGEFFDYGFGRDSANEPRIHWVVVGGESGPKARPCDVEWVRSVVWQCKAAGVPAFCKQLGAKPYTKCYDCTCVALEVHYNKLPHRLGCYSALRLRDPKGGDPQEWPSDLRVREFPR